MGVCIKWWLDLCCAYLTALPTLSCLRNDRHGVKRSRCSRKNCPEHSFGVGSIIISLRIQTGCLSEAVNQNIFPLPDEADLSETAVSLEEWLFLCHPLVKLPSLIFGFSFMALAKHRSVYA